LAEGEAPATADGVQPHQTDVCLLVGRIERDQLAECLDCGRAVARGLLRSREVGHDRDVFLGQSVPR
jgi:hypothetical protein